ncbi:molybdopterin converting factor subunit 1 [Macrococcus equipercicus]|uniref:Molybdopterin synthase sulfur carrier subunit n=1 Tax=Macrococcus equipercicus TaxID=69967 RepID=A0A9Q9F3G1_9STAP|nr:molybdopterin converting factor subunit 1 [Macrococcus equipercicus]KAA1039633.1 molybdopterin converting factor subunit 1 [Macrococcus equipercicus]UTH13964.1 molybdopterin converting factor subunit 1 [Macrococcus equipercicus]
MRVLYFAHIKELINRTEDNFTFSNELSVKEFRKHLNETYPFLQGEKFQIAVNEEVVSDEELVNNGDVIALIPPVSGG